MPTHINCYIEIESAGSQRTDDRRYQDAIASLRHARVGNHAVQFVIAKYEEPTRVPFFGYSSTHQQSDNVPLHGVLRYFNINLIVEGEMSLLHTPTCYRVTPYARLYICGVSYPQEVTCTLEPIKE